MATISYQDTKLNETYCNGDTYTVSTRGTTYTVTVAARATPPFVQRYKRPEHVPGGYRRLA
jgi:hypothetical protein